MTFPGRVVITERALGRTFGALAADVLGVEARSVQTRLHDSSGRLAVELEGPVSTGTLELTGTTVVGCADSAVARIKDDGSRLTGTALGPVRVRISGAQITETRRAT